MTRVLLEALAGLLPPGSVRRRLAAGTFWSAAGGACAQGLALVAFVLVARILGPETFGELGMLQATIASAGVLAGFGLGPTVTKHVAELRSSHPARAGRIIALSLAASMAFGILIALPAGLAADRIVSGYLGAPQLAGSLRIGCALLLLNAVNGVQIGALAGFEAFPLIARVNLVRGLSLLVAILAGAWFAGLPGAVAGMAASAALTFAASHSALVRGCASHGVRIAWVAGLAEWRILLGFSMPAFLSAAVGASAVWAASASLARLPEGYIELGFFTAANNWRTAMAFLPSMLSSAAIPIFASLIVQRDGRRDRGLESYHLANSSLTWLLAGSIVVLSPWIMRAYGPAYADRWQVLVVLALGAAIGMQGNTMGTVIQARGLMWTGLTINLVWAAVLLAVAFAARGYGALGLGIAYPAAYLAIMPPTALLLAWLGLISPAIARRALSAGAALALLLPAALAIHAARLGPASSSALLAALVAGAYAASENAAARRLLARACGLLPARDRRPALERAS